MYLRIISGQVQPGKADELAARWKEYFGTRLPNVPGLLHTYFSVDRATDTIVSVSIWDREPEQARMQPLIDDFISQVSNLVSVPPQVAGYEVLAEI